MMMMMTPPPLCLSLRLARGLATDRVLLPGERAAVAVHMLRVDVQDAQLLGHVAHKQPLFIRQLGRNQRISGALKNRREHVTMGLLCK